MAEEVDQYLCQMCFAVEVRHISSTAPTAHLNLVHTSMMLE